MPVKFSLDKRENIAHECSIRLSWSWRSTRYQTTIGQRIKSSDWNTIIGRPLSGGHNNNGVSTEKIGQIINGICRAVYHAESIAHGNNMPIQKYMMTGIIRELLSEEFVDPIVIAQKWMNISDCGEKDIVEYYTDGNGHYFRTLCTAYYPTIRSNLKIIQELFGEKNIIAESANEFHGIMKDGTKHYGTYCKIDKSEVKQR